MRRSRCLLILATVGMLAVSAGKASALDPIEQIDNQLDPNTQTVGDSQVFGDLTANLLVQADIPVVNPLLINPAIVFTPIEIKHVLKQKAENEQEQKVETLGNFAVGVVDQAVHNVGNVGVQAAIPIVTNTLLSAGVENLFIAKTPVKIEQILKQKAENEQEQKIDAGGNVAVGAATQAAGAIGNIGVQAAIPIVTNTSISPITIGTVSAGVESLFIAKTPIKIEQILKQKAENEQEQNIDAGGNVAVGAATQAVGAIGNIGVQAAIPIVANTSLSPITIGLGVDAEGDGIENLFIAKTPIKIEQVLKQKAENEQEQKIDAGGNVAVGAATQAAGAIGNLGVQAAIPIVANTSLSPITIGLGVDAEGDGIDNLFIAKTPIKIEQVLKQKADNEQEQKIDAGGNVNAEGNVAVGLATQAVGAVGNIGVQAAAPIVANTSLSPITLGLGVAAGEDGTPIKIEQELKQANCWPLARKMGGVVWDKVYG
jgi:hypothetical protein